MKSVYFVQASSVFGTKDIHIPYACGCVAAYAWQNPVIQENYTLAGFRILRETPARAAAALVQPDIVAFSNYVWNFEYHKALAQEIKKLWPDCLILFAGHHIQNDSPAQLAEHPFADYLIHGAGEVPFEAFLLALAQGTGFASIPSFSWRDADGTLHKTENMECSFVDFPSPYLTGIFDSLIEAYPHLQFSITTESNRGCPYHCAFCDWGTERQKLLQISMERVKAEIDWAAAHKIEYIYFADANFGILPRDEEIMDYLIRKKASSGYPHRFNTCYAKNSNETILRLSKKAHDAKLSSGATFSFQSLHPEVLKIIGRSNLEVQRTKELLAMYNTANLPVYTELILGLPGETAESFRSGIGSLLASGMHGVLEIYPCQLLPNARLSRPEFVETYGIQAMHLPQHQWHTAPGECDEIQEYADIVTATAAMPRADWVQSIVFSSIVQGLHSCGLLKYIAIYLYTALGLAYDAFYLAVQKFAEANPATLIGKVIGIAEEHFRGFADGDGAQLVFYDKRFGEITWPAGEFIFLSLASEAVTFFKEVRGILKSYAIPAALTEELAAYQLLSLNLPQAQPEEAHYDWDFPAFFAAAVTEEKAALQENSTYVRYSKADRTYGDWPAYARECVWYGRRKGLLTRKVTDVCYDT
ncbi:MAG: radical SAM protein [Oscillospiraceae bacterium]|jgi:putative methyltransferase|nr:radical SAM protein [Oscillospiraceae bacterium]